MPQLTGPEQKILVQLLVAHLSEPGQLDRSLLHAGFGHLSNYSQKGTMDAMTSDLVMALSNQYRIGEFVDAVLNGDFLKGQCPPIEKWLESNRSELQQRKLNPTSVDSQPAEGSLGSGRLLWLRWLLVPLVAVIAAWVYLHFFPGVSAAIGPLQGQLIDLQNSAPLITIYQSHPTRGMRDLTDEIGVRADGGAFGSVFFCNPLESAVENPTVEVRVIDANGQRLDDPDGIFEIHWLPPDHDREESGRWGPKLHLKDGIITDRYDGSVPVGTVITVVYQCREPHPFPLTFHGWLK